MVSTNEQPALIYFLEKKTTVIEGIALQLGVSAYQVKEFLARSLRWHPDAEGEMKMHIVEDRVDSVASSVARNEQALSNLQMLSDVIGAEKTFKKWDELQRQYTQYKSNYDQHELGDFFSDLFLNEPRDASNYWRCVYELVYRTICATGLLSEKWAPNVRSTALFEKLTPMERRYAMEFERGLHHPTPIPFCTVRHVQRITTSTPDDKCIMRTSSRMHNLQVLFAHMSASYNVPYIRHVSAKEHDTVQDSKCYQCSHDHVVAGTLLANTREQIVCVLRDLQTIRITPTSNYGRFEVHSLVNPTHSVFRELFGVRSNTGAFTFIEDTKMTLENVISYGIRCYDPIGHDVVGCKISYNHRMKDVDTFLKAQDDTHLNSQHSTAYLVKVKLDNLTFIERETTALVLFKDEQELTCVNDILRGVSYDENTPKADVHRYAIALDCMDVSYIDLLRTVCTHPTYKEVLYVQESDSKPDELVVHVNFKYRKNGLGQDHSETTRPVVYFRFSKYQSHITMYIDVRVLFLSDVCITLMLMCINQTPRQPPYTQLRESGDLNVSPETIERVYMQYAEDMALNSNHIGNIKTNRRFPIILNTAQAFMCMKAHKRHFFMKYPLKRDETRMQTEQMSARIQSSLHGMFFTTLVANEQDTMPTVSDYSFGSRIIYDTTLVPTTIQTSNKKPHFLARTGFPKDGITPNECRYLLFSYYSVCVALHFRQLLTDHAPIDVALNCATYITCILHPFLSLEKGDVRGLPPYTPKQLDIMRREQLEYAPGRTTRKLCRTYPTYEYNPQSDVDVSIQLHEDLSEDQFNDGIGLLDDLVCSWESLGPSQKVMKVRDSVVTDKIRIQHLPVRLFTPIVHAGAQPFSPRRVCHCTED